MTYFDSELDVTDFWADWVGGHDGAVYTACFNHGQTKTDEGMVTPDPKLVSIKVETHPNVPATVLAERHIPDLLTEEQIKQIQDMQYQKLLDAHLFPNG